MFGCLTVLSLDTCLEGSCCCDQLFFHGFSSMVSMTDLVETMEEKLVTATVALQGTC